MMNGEQLTFEDNSFDKVVGMYVVSVTQNPNLLIEEMKESVNQMVTFIW